MTSIEDLEKELLKLERLLELQEQQSATSVVEKTRALTTATYQEAAADSDLKTEITFTITSGKEIPADSKIKITGLTGSETLDNETSTLFKGGKPTWIKDGNEKTVIWNQTNGSLEMVVKNKIALNTQLNFTIILGTTGGARLTGKTDQPIEIEITDSTGDTSIESKTIMTEETPAVVAVVAEAGAKDDATAKPEANTVIELTRKMQELTSNITKLTDEIKTLKTERDNYKNDLFNERKSSSTAYSFVYTLNSAKTDLEKTTDARLSLTKQLEDKEALRAGLQTQLTNERAVGTITIGSNTRDSLAKQLANERGDGTVNLYNDDNTAQNPALRDSFKKQLDAKEALRAGLDTQLTNERDNTHSTGGFTDDLERNDSLAKQAKDYKDELVNERTNGPVAGTWKKFEDNGSLKSTPLGGETLAKQLSDALTAKAAAEKAKKNAEATSAAADSKAVADLKADLADEQSKLKLEKAEHTKTKQDYLDNLKAIDNKITALLSIGSTK